MKIILFLRVRMTEKERNFGNGVVDYSIGTTFVVIFLEEVLIANTHRTNCSIKCV